MDPDKALEALQQLAKQVNAGDPSDAWLFAELFEGLDEWIRRGGFLPKAWAKPPSELP